MATETMAHTRRADAWERVRASILLALAYVATGRLGLLLAEHQPNATLVWAPTGISLAVLILRGRRLWPGVFAGAFVVNVMMQTPLAAALGISVGNTLEAVAGATLLRRWGRFEPGLSRATDVLRFLLAAVACTLVSATVGVGSLIAGGVVESAAAPVAWLDWWLGDLGGAVVVGPIVLVSARGRPAFGELARRKEAWGALALVALSSTLAFSTEIPVELRLPLALLGFPLLLWSGLRFGPRGAMLAATVVAVVAFVGVARGGGPFVDRYGLYLTLAYVCTIGAVASVLAAAIAERELAQQRQGLERDERLKVEAQLQRQQRLEELGVLAGGVAHDFNNLLVPIYANAEVLRRSVAESERSLVDDILRSAQHARDLSQQLLTYAGKQDASLEPLDLGEVVERVCAFVLSSLGSNVHLVRELRAWPHVVGDRTLLRQLLINLILNANEAIGADGGTIRVELGVEASPDGGERAVVRVADNGCGMDARTRERLFDPFYTTKSAGRGLGLSAVAGIVRLHEGVMDVESSQGKGATFRLSLPATEAPASVAENGSGAEPEPLAIRKLLVADDDAVVRRTVVRLLTEAGYDVVVAVDGRDAVDKFADHADELSLALLDVTMPRMAGTEAAAEIRRRAPELPIVLMSGFTGGLRAGEAAADLPFIAKPFTVDELLATLEAALDDSSRRARLELVR